LGGGRPALSETLQTNCRRVQPPQAVCAIDARSETVKAWERRRNRDKARIKWLFTLERAREKARPRLPCGRPPAGHPGRRVKTVNFSVARY
jgi:hypothetical protein